MLVSGLPCTYFWLGETRLNYRDKGTEGYTLLMTYYGEWHIVSNCPASYLLLLHEFEQGI